LTTTAFDRLSLVHLVLFAILTAGVAIAQILPLSGPVLRLISAIAGAALTLAIMGIWLPEFLNGPMAAMDPLVYEVWFRHNAEVSPALNFANLSRTAPKAVAHLGLVLIAVPALACQIRRSRDEHRLNWLILAIFLALSLAMAMAEARWMGYAQVLSLPPCIALLQALFARFQRPGMGSAMVRICAVILLATGPLIGAGLIRKAMPMAKQGASCDVAEMARYLGETYPDRAYRLFNFIYAGPALLFHSHHAVVATPYHRNTAGIVDTINFFRATELAPAQALIERRGIDFVLICPDDPEASNYRSTDGPLTLLMRLEQGQPPGWLTAIPLVPGLAENYKLFQVSR
jgi:uncharacterized membrane protein YhaH (DUF805 family)